MTPRIALCVDESTCRNPEMMGLDGEALASQKWLEVFSRGGEARRGIGKDRQIGRAWVISCDDVEPINLAASIKSDRPELHVSLVTPESCGSLFSRAHTAHIDEVLQRSTFLRNYLEAKGRLAGAFDHEERAGQAPRNTPSTSHEHDADRERGLSPSRRTDPPGRSRTPRTLQSEPPDELSRIIRQVPSEGSKRAFILTIVSGSGGSGKSSVSALAALAASRRGYRTLLLDYDLQFGDVASMVGVEDALDIDAALSHPEKLERELRRNRKMSVLSAPSRIEVAEEVARSVPDLIDRLSVSFDVIVANTGAAWAEQHAALLERSSAALFLVDQRASSLRACQHALDLCARCGIATGPFQFAVNRCSKGAPLTAVDVSCALQGASVYELKDGGRDVEDCLGNGAAAELLEMKNDFSRSVEQVMERLLPAEEGSLAVEDEDERPPRLRGRRQGRKRGRRLL